MNWKVWHRRDLPSIAAANPENPSTKLSSPDTWLYTALGSEKSSTGVMVGPETSMRASAVYACVRLLAETIATLPLMVYRREDRGRTISPEHRLFYLLHDEPQPTMTSAFWRELMVQSLLLRGNAYSLIVRDRANRPVELHWIHPSRVQPFKVDGRLRYTIRLADGSEETLDQSNMLHVPGASFDGIAGKTIISAFARDQVGLALAMEEHGGKLWANGAHHIGLLKHPTKLSDKAIQRLKAQLLQFLGVSNAGKTMVLEEGLDWQQISMTSEDAQYIESRRFQVEEIARIFRVPLHMIGEQTKNTSWGSGVEHMSIGFVTWTLRPLLTKFEQEYNRKLFSDGLYFSEHKVEGLLRGDSKARADFYSSAHQNGWMTVNEIRELENLPPTKDGDQLFVNGNMQPISQAGREAVKEAEQIAGQA